MCAAVSDVVSFIADLVGIAVAVGAVVTAWWHRGKLGSFLNLLEVAFLSQRVQKVRDTLAQLHRLDYGKKSHRPQVKGLLGTLCGQLRLLSEDHPSLRTIYEEIKTVESEQWNDDSEKLRIVAEVEGTLDKIVYGQHQNSARNSNG